MSPWDAMDLENAQDVLTASDIGYWARAWWRDGALHVVEHDDDTEHRITPRDFLDWLADGAGPREVLAVIGDTYQMRAIEDLMVQQWDELDYDAETGDLMVQQMLFEEVRYG